MATKSMSYDHPADLVREIGAVTALAGGSAVKGKYVAFTDMLLKSVTAVVTIAGTTDGAAAAIEFSHVSGTSTTSVGIITFGTGPIYQTSTNVVLANGTTVMAQGDMVIGESGADLTLVVDLAYEMVIVPRADVTN